MPSNATYGVPRLDLGQALMEYDFSEANNIAQQILTPSGVPFKSSKQPVITRESLMGRANVQAGPNGQYNETDYKFEDMTYDCEDRGLVHPLHDDVRARYARDFDAEFMATTLSWEKTMREDEILVASKIFNTTTWTGAALTTAVTTEWSTITATIKADVAAAKEMVRKLTGMIPNALICSSKVFTNISLNTQLNNAVQYTQFASDEVVRSKIAEFLGLKYVLVGGGVYNAETSATASVSDIWDEEYAMVCRIAPPGADLQYGCIGRTYTWTASSPSIGGLIVEEYREENRRSWMYRVRHNVDFKIHDPYFGHLLSNITA